MCPWGIIYGQVSAVERVRQDLTGWYRTGGGGIRVLLIGGLYHPATASFSSEGGLEVIKRVRINKAFISAGGVHAAAGVSCVNFYEVSTKQAALDMTLTSYVVADTSKYGKVKPAFFADCKDFSGAVNEVGILDAAGLQKALAGAALHEAGAGVFS